MEIRIRNSPWDVVLLVIDESFASDVDKETTQIVKQNCDLGEGRNRINQHALMVFTLDEGFNY